MEERARGEGEGTTAYDLIALASVSLMVARAGAAQRHGRCCVAWLIEAAAIIAIAIRLSGLIKSRQKCKPSGDLLIGVHSVCVTEVVAMPPPGGCARGGGQWAGTHGPPRSVPARRVEEDNGTQ